MACREAPNHLCLIAWPLANIRPTRATLPRLPDLCVCLHELAKQEKLNAGLYRTKEMFMADINLMCDNCKTYNPPDTIFFKAALDIKRVCDEEMRRLGLL